MALLAGLVALRSGAASRHALPLRALHIHHHLQVEADDWARGCRRLGRGLGVPVVVRHVEVRRGKGASLEAEARDARRKAFAAALRPGEALLTAHHLDDQLETLLLMLMRGAGVDGLAAMPEAARFGAGWMLRPLLGTTREDIEAYVTRHRLPAVVDPSNADERFDRNYLRRRVTPLLRARWPAAARVAARSAARLGEARGLLGELAMADLEGLLRPAAPGGKGGAALELGALARLSAARQRNALRAWLRAAGAPLPDAVHLERIRLELAGARADAQPAVRWAGVEVRRYRGSLYFLGAESLASSLSGTQAWRWSGGRAFELGPGRGRLRWVADRAGPIARAALPPRLTVRARTPGERVAVGVGGPRRELGELMREAGVLPWERARLPLVCAGEAIVAVPGLFVSAAYAAKPAGRGARLRLEWQDAPAVLAAR